MQDSILQITAIAAEYMLFSSHECTPVLLSNGRHIIDNNNDLLTASITGPLMLSMRQKKSRFPQCYESWIRKYENYDFFCHFRMSQETFQRVFRELIMVDSKEEAEKTQETQKYNSVPQEKGVLLTLWFLAKGETLSSCAERFHIGISTAHLITTKNIKKLVQLRQKFIKWPTQDEAEHIANSFYQLSGYQGVIGAIDGTHFQCVVPKDQHDSYVNRKFQHSIIMQAICDSEKLLTDIFVGFPGSCNDGRVFRESPLFRNITENGPSTLFYNKFHLVGDKAYACYEWLMTPYKDTGRLTKNKKKHNYMLSKARVLIENVFSLLKGRWRVLHFINVYSIEKVVNIVVACAVLHNLCLLNNDAFEALNNSEEQFGNDIADHGSMDTKKGMAKRDLLCETLISHH